MPQVTRRLTHKRYCGAAIFTDHFSDLIYPHLIHFTNMEETMEEKYAYERFAHHHSVKIRHSRGDNMRYNETDFIDSCKHTNQKFNYCGVEAHHQNDMAETKNKILAYGARTLILYAKIK